MRIQKYFTTHEYQVHPNSDRWLPVTQWWDYDATGQFGALCKMTYSRNVRLFVVIIDTDKVASHVEELTEEATVYLLRRNSENPDLYPKSEWFDKNESDRV